MVIMIKMGDIALQSLLLMNDDSGNLIFTNKNENFRAG